MAEAPKMLTVMFPDGTEIQAYDPTDFLRRLGNIQWTPMDVDEMKRALSDRAYAWSREAIDPLLPDPDFLAALDRTGMLAVIRDPAPGKPGRWSEDGA